MLVEIKNNLACDMVYKLLAIFSVATINVERSFYLMNYVNNKLNKKTWGAILE